LKVSGFTYLEPFIRFGLKPFVEAMIAAAKIAFNALDSIGTGLRVTGGNTCTSRRNALKEFTLPLLPKPSEVVVRGKGRDEVGWVLRGRKCRKDDITGGGMGDGRNRRWRH
jgi:hypothetical protein